MAKAIPDGYHSVTTSLTFKDTQKALDVYKKAFNAKVIDVFPGMDGKGIMHAVFQIGNSYLMCGDEMPGHPESRSAETMGGSPMGFFIYVNDADASFKQAVDAGCSVAMPMSDMFWGDRAGSVKDPFGYSWMIATHRQDLTKDQVRKNAEAFFAQFAKNGK